MAIHKVIEVLSQSEKSWEDATQRAVADAGKTVENIKSIWVKNFEAVVKDNKIVEYRVNANITFEVKESISRPKAGWLGPGAPALRQRDFFHWACAKSDTGSGNGSNQPPRGVRPTIRTYGTRCASIRTSVGRLRGANGTAPNWCK